MAWSPKVQNTAVLLRYYNGRESEETTLQVIHISTLGELSKLSPDCMRKLAALLCSWASTRENAKRKAAPAAPIESEGETNAAE